MKFLIMLFLLVPVVSQASLPVFLKKVGNSYQEKRVILVTEKYNNKYAVVAAYFPDNTCVKYPDSTILELPHRFVLEKDHDWVPCTALIPH